MGCDIHPWLEVRIGGVWYATEASAMINRIQDDSGQQMAELLEIAEAKLQADPQLDPRRTYVDAEQYVSIAELRSAAAAEAALVGRARGLFTQMMHLRIPAHVSETGDRNYTWFGFLCGVRRPDCQPQVSETPRGLPADVTAAVGSRISSDNPDMHSQSWADLADFTQHLPKLMQPILPDNRGENMAMYLSVPDFLRWEQAPHSPLDAAIKTEWHFQVAGSREAGVPPLATPEQLATARAELSFGAGVDTGLRMSGFSDLYVPVPKGQARVSRAWDWGMSWYPEFVAALTKLARNLEIADEDVRLVFAFDN